MNSYTRLVPGYEAPIKVAWSEKNRSPLVRMPDTSCNPYLALAVMMAAGLDGVKRELHPGPPINKNIFTMSNREKRRLRIGQLPANLSEALDEMEKDEVVKEAFGEHILDNYLKQALGCQPTEETEEIFFSTGFWRN